MKKEFMSDNVKISIVCSATIIILALLIVFYSSGASSSNTIEANGIASINVVPDLVTVNYNIEAFAKNASSAKDDASETLEILTRKLVSSGFDKEELQTISFSVNPEYDWNYNQRRQIGYRAYHSLKIELPASDFEKISSAIDAGINSGSDISHINFELSPSKQSEYKAEALRLAGEDARMKAEASVSGLDKKLGRLVSVSVSEFNYYPWMVYGEVREDSAYEAKDSVVQIVPGEQSVSASIRVVYRIR